MLLLNTIQILNVTIVVPMLQISKLCNVTNISIVQVLQIFILLKCDKYQQY